VGESHVSFGDKACDDFCLLPTEQWPCGKIPSPPQGRLLCQGGDFGLVAAFSLHPAGPASGAVGGFRHISSRACFWHATAAVGSVFDCHQAAAKLFRKAVEFGPPKDAAALPLPQLLAADYVYVRSPPIAPALTPPYRSPHAVHKRSQKIFIIKVGSRYEVITVDRLKPHLAAHRDRQFRRAEAVLRRLLLHQSVRLLASTGGG
jgi:hypothetical protein